MDLTRILLFTLFTIAMIYPQGSKDQHSDPILSAIHGVELSSSENRLPELLNDAKVLLSDAFIADILSDTFEVVYNLNRIFDLLAEADQYGEMDIEDKEEFEQRMKKEKEAVIKPMPTSRKKMMGHKIKQMILQLRKQRQIHPPLFPLLGLLV